MLCLKQCRLVCSSVDRKGDSLLYNKIAIGYVSTLLEYIHPKLSLQKEQQRGMEMRSLGKESVNVTRPSWVGRCVWSEIADQLFCSKSGGPPQPHLPPTPSAFEVPVEHDVSAAGVIRHRPTAPPDLTAPHTLPPPWFSSLLFLQCVQASLIGSCIMLVLILVFIMTWKYIQ